MNSSGYQIESLERRVLLAGTISGTVYDDLNGNGRRDSGEPGLVNQDVFLDQDFNGQFAANEPKRVTDSAGAYSFTKLENGVARVRVVAPTGRRQTSPAGVFYDIAVTPTTNVNGRNFGLTATAIIRGTVFNDLDRDARRSAGEPGLGGWTVFLDKDNDGALDPNEKVRVTNSAGDYRFAGLTPGTYRVRTVQKLGFIRTVPTSGVWVVSNLGPGQSVSGRNFGEREIDNPRP